MNSMQLSLKLLPQTELTLRRSATHDFVQTIRPSTFSAAITIIRLCFGQGGLGACRVCHITSSDLFQTVHRKRQAMP